MVCDVTVDVESLRQDFLHCKPADVALLYINIVPFAQFKGHARLFW